MAQETFLKAYRVRKTLGDVENIRSWLYRTGYRRFLDDQRKGHRRDALLDGQVAFPAAATHSSQGLRLDIERAMGALPPERRACAMLCLALGHSHSEVAAITELPLGTVKSHVARARAALQIHLKEYDHADAR